MLKNHPSIAIVGAGLTGLVAAFYLRRAGFGVTVFDTAERAGGVIRTCGRDGFVWECGPNTGVLGKPEAVELFEDLGRADLLERAAPVAKKRYIWKGKRWEAIPSGIVSGLLTPLFSWKDKLTLPLELFRPRGTDPEENLSSFVRRRLGQSILDYAVDPFVSGVYAGSPDVIIPKYALPKLYALEAEHGGFLRGSLSKMLSPRSERDRKATRETFSARGGLERLVEALVDSIGQENLRLGREKLEFTPGPAGWEARSAKGSEGLFAQVIHTAGAHALASLFPSLPQKDLDKASTVRYAQVAEIAIGYKRWQGMALDGFGGLVPSKEKRDLLGVLFMSSLMRGRAPEGGALFAVFAGGLRRPDLMDLDESALRKRVGQEFCSMMGLKEFAPDLYEVKRHRRAIPQYDASTPARLSAMEALEKQYPGLLIGGNGRDGIGMADRIRQGRLLAQRLEIAGKE